MLTSHPFSTPTPFLPSTIFKSAEESLDAAPPAQVDSTTTKTTSTTTMTPAASITFRGKRPNFDCKSLAALSEAGEAPSGICPTLQAVPVAASPLPTPSLRGISFPATTGLLTGGRRSFDPPVASPSPEPSSRLPPSAPSSPSERPIPDDSSTRRVDSAKSSAASSCFMALPHSTQNFASAGSSRPHSLQYISSSPMLHSQFGIMPQASSVDDSTTTQNPNNPSPTNRR